MKPYCKVDVFEFFAGLLYLDESAPLPSIPGYTLVDIEAPPDAGDNEGYRLDGSTWALQQDLRGSRWVDPDAGEDVLVADVPGYVAPPGYVLWVNGTARPESDASSLSQAKARKNSAINAARLRANQSHFTFAGKQIAVDPLSRSDIDAAHGAILMLQSLPGGWPGAWKAMDNSYVSIPDVATWGAFYGAMVAQGTANFAHAQALKSQLAAATTLAEVEAVPVW